MKRQMLWLFIGCFVVYPQVGLAQIQTIRKEVRQIFGGSQSPDNARIGAITRAKREALEEAGTYLQSLTIVRNLQLEKDEILALSAGMLRVTVIEEEPFVEGTAFGIRIVVEVQVDLSTLEERVRNLLADSQQFDRLLEVERRQRELLERLAALEAENARLAAGGTTRQHETLKERFRESTAKLTAQEWYNKGVALWNGNGYDPPQKAAEHFSQALRLDPDFAFAYITRGLAYDELRQYQWAIEDYDQAIRLDPDYAVAYYNRGNAYGALGQHQRAIEDYDQAIRLDPDLALVYNNRGVAYTALGQHQRSIEDYDQALRLDPDLAAAYAVRGAAYGNLGQYQRSIEDYDQAIRLDPDLAPHLGRGLAYTYLGQYQRAIEDFNQVIRLDPDLAAGYGGRGIAYAGLGQYQRSIEDYDQAIRLDLDDAAFYGLRGVAYSGLGQYKRAIKDFNQVIRLDPEDAIAYDSRGGSYNKLGQREKAFQNWRKACELGYQPACEKVK